MKRSPINFRPLLGITKQQNPKGLALFATALLKLPDDSGAKRLIEVHRTDTSSIEFEPGAVDIDTPQDLDHLEGRASVSD